MGEHFPFIQEVSQTLQGQWATQLADRLMKSQTLPTFFMTNFQPVEEKLTWVLTEASIGEWS